MGKRFIFKLQYFLLITIILLLVSCPAGNEPEVTGVIIADAAATVARGGAIQFTALVDSRNGANQSIKWTLDGGNGKSSISNNGLLTVAENETANTLLTVNAVSVFNPSKSDSRIVTVRADLALVYNINISLSANGSVTSDRLSATEGLPVTLSMVPADYCRFYSISASRGGGFSVPLNEIEPGKTFSFIMPNSHVTVKTVFREDEAYLFTHPDLLWYDDFSGNSLDTGKWNYEIGTGRQYGSNIDGWGNNELQYYHENNVIVKDGILYLEAKRENVGGRNFTSGKINSGGVLFPSGYDPLTGPLKYAVIQGRVEARMRLPRGQGFWPAFWLIGINNNQYSGVSSVVGWPRCGEIDIMEMQGHLDKNYGSTIHFGEAWPQNSHRGSNFSHTGSLSDEFNVYGLILDNTSVRFTFNGELWQTISLDSLGTGTYPYRDSFTNPHGFAIILNLAVGGNYLPEPYKSPLTTAFTTGAYEDRCLEVDWVRVLKK